jgi:transcriptional regulator with XRE-family HTH domain
MRARLNAGLTQEQLGVLSGMSRQAIHAMEQGAARPQAPNAKRVADVLGVLADDLFPVEPVPVPSPGSEERAA